MRHSSRGGEGYTREEQIVLATIRRGSGRTCADCAWLVLKGKHRGCYPQCKYRKWLSFEEFDSGCDLFHSRKSDR